MNSTFLDSTILELLNHRERFGITDSLLGDVRTAGKLTLGKLDYVIESFYDWLEAQPEDAVFFADEGVKERVKHSQRAYWETFFEGNVDERYVANRCEVGATHLRIGLSLSMYFAGNTVFQNTWNELLSASGGDGLKESVASLLSFDAAIVVETYNQKHLETIEGQNRALAEMSTPVTEIWTGVLLLPLVGLIDSKRAQDTMDAVLAEIATTHARVFILDISGVGVVDTAVANHLIKITKATNLMGCESTISGVSPAIAQTIVELGIDIAMVNTTSTMRDALEHALDRVGLRIEKARDRG